MSFFKKYFDKVCFPSVVSHLHSMVHKTAQYNFISVIVPEKILLTCSYLDGKMSCYEGHYFLQVEFYAFDHIAGRVICLKTADELTVCPVSMEIIIIVDHSVSTDRRNMIVILGKQVCFQHRRVHELDRF